VVDSWAETEGDSHPERCPVRRNGRNPELFASFAANVTLIITVVGEPVDFDRRLVRIES
jgi:hypothetical protein